MALAAPPDAQRRVWLLWCTGARRMATPAQCAHRTPPCSLTDACIMFQIIRHGRIVTTLARAKAVRKRVDHMITLSKDGSLHARRQVQHDTDNTRAIVRSDFFSHRRPRNPESFVGMLRAFSRDTYREFPRVGLLALCGIAIIDVPACPENVHIVDLVVFCPSTIHTRSVCV